MKTIFSTAGQTKKQTSVSVSSSISFYSSLRSIAHALLFPRHFLMSLRSSLITRNVHSFVYSKRWKNLCLRIKSTSRIGWPWKVRKMLVILWRSRKRSHGLPVTTRVSTIYHLKEEELVEEYPQKMGFSNFKASLVPIFLGWVIVAWIRALLCLLWLLIEFRWIWVMIYRRIVKWSPRMALFFHQWSSQGQIRLLSWRHLRVSSRFHRTAQFQE